VVVTAVAATVLRQAQDHRATALPAIDPRVVVTVAATGVATAAAVANNVRPNRPRKTSSNTAYIIYMYSEPFCLQDGFLFLNFNYPATKSFCNLLILNTYLYGYF
jgi:adenine/guanine phosphoribosyltransferase-like PRPP-binding protein